MATTIQGRRELDLKAREVAAREREVTAKEDELKRSRWLNPVVLGLFAAAAGLIGNVIVARVNNENTQAVERLRLQSNLILEAIKTDPKSACTNLLFFVGLGFLDDSKNTVRKACQSSSPEDRPSLQVAPYNGIRITVLEDLTGVPIPGARIFVPELHSVWITTSNGLFFLPQTGLDRLQLRVEKPGYITKEIYADARSPIVISLEKQR